MQPPAELLDYPPTQAALSISKEAGFSRAELAAYQAVMLAISNEKSLASDFIEKGRQDEKLAIACKLLAVMDDAAIAQATGLSVAQVQRLRMDRQQT